jgi:hypothetical protein
LLPQKLDKDVMVDPARIVIGRQNVIEGIEEKAWTVCKEAPGARGRRSFRGGIAANASTIAML